MIADHVVQLPAWASARTVHSYVDSLPGEIGTRSLLQAAWDAGKQVIVPYLDAPRAPMKHARLTSFDALVAGPWGLLQPEPADFVDEPPTADVVLVPGLRFDRDGYRIGQGGGYYDRLLRDIDGATFLGLTYDDCLVDRIPRQPHDIAVHAIITPRGVTATTT